MTKIKINLPDKIHFTTNAKIENEHINYGNHLSNDKVLTFCNTVRIEFLKSIGSTEIDIFGLGIIMKDATIEFISEGKLNDELQIDIAIEIVSSVFFNIYYHLFTTKNTIAKVKTGMLFFDYQNKNVKKIPNEFIEMFG